MVYIVTSYPRQKHGLIEYSWAEFMKCVCIKAIQMWLDVQLYHPEYLGYPVELNCWNLGMIV